MHSLSLILPLSDGEQHATCTYIRGKICWDTINVSGCMVLKMRQREKTTTDKTNAIEQARKETTEGETQTAVGHNFLRMKALRQIRYHSVRNKAIVVNSPILAVCGSQWATLWSSCKTYQSSFNTH